jgi:hypothetical protein
MKEISPFSLQFSKDEVMDLGEVKESFEVF